MPAIKLSANFATQGFALFEKRFIVAKRNMGLTLCQLLCPALLSFMTLFFLLRSITLSFHNLPLTPEANYNTDFYPVDERNNLPFLATAGAADKNLMQNGGWLDPSTLTSSTFGFGGNKVQLSKSDKTCPWSGEDGGCQSSSGNPASGAGGGDQPIPSPMAMRQIPQTQLENL
jgi:hypothetical protein